MSKSRATADEADIEAFDELGAETDAAGPGTVVSVGATAVSVSALDADALADDELGRAGIVAGYFCGRLMARVSHP